LQDNYFKIEAPARNAAAYKEWQDAHNHYQHRTLSTANETHKKSIDGEDTHLMNKHSKIVQTYNKKSASIFAAKTYFPL
jgi:hypothetical protein